LPLLQNEFLSLKRTAKSTWKSAAEQEATATVEAQDCPCHGGFIFMTGTVQGMVPPALAL
jgi:hypothetical protein